MAVTHGLKECEALTVLCEIEKMLISKGIWFSVYKAREPGLKAIEIKATIKVKE